MGVADGTVVGTTKIVDHGPDALRWTLVLLSEGYRDVELPTFHADAERFVNHLFATAPFTQLWCAINMYRVDVSSTDSGADEPATCADGTTGTGVSASTYFDATFCFADTARLLYGDEALALATATAAVPEVDATLVIVNSARYGGAGGPATAWFSTHADADEIGLHELGHTAFRLLDEYGDIHDTWTGGEPFEPNITSIIDRATTKWAGRIAPATPLPTQTNPDCTTESSGASPVAAGTIGLFEGGGRARCGLYRAEHSCRMRTLGQPFCAICQEAISARLRPHLPAFSGPRVGVQFQGTVPAGSSTRWFTYDWPACWHVLWSVAPVGAVVPAPGIGLRVEVERASRERVTYWLTVTNAGSAAVDIEGRYAVVANV
jgi:hypothetical protein